MCGTMRIVFRYIILREFYFLSSDLNIGRLPTNYYFYFVENIEAKYIKCKTSNHIKVRNDKLFIYSYCLFGIRINSIYYILL